MSSNEEEIRRALLRHGFEIEEKKPKAARSEFQSRAEAGDPRATKYAEAALAGEVRNILVLEGTEGARNQTLNNAALKMGSLVAAGFIDGERVLEELTEAALHVGLDEAEIDQTAPRAMRDGMKDPREVSLAEVEDDEFAREMEERWAARAGNGTPPPDSAAVAYDYADFWSAREELAVVRQFARSRIVSPWAVLGGVLARVVCATAPNLTLPPIVGGEMSLNLFVALTGKSGTGKDASFSVAREAVTISNDAVILQPGSGEGIAHAFGRAQKDGTTEIHTDRVLFNISEIDTFAALSARKGATLTSVLRDCFGGAPLGFAYADASKRLNVGAHAYRMCLIAGVQPGRAGALLDDADGGTPQRFLWVPTADPSMPDEAPEQPMPFLWRDPVGMDLDFRPTAHQMAVCGRAVEEIRATQRLAVKNGGADGKYDGHLLLTKLKAAAALAVLNGRADVTDEDWDLADYVIHMSLATRETVVEHRKAEARVINDKVGEKAGYREFATEQAKLAARAVTVERVARWLLPKLGDWGTAGQIRKMANSRDRHYLNEALTHLVDSGDVEVDKAGGSTRYKARL